MRTRLPVVVVGCLVSLFLATSGQCRTKATVVTTNPPNGATDVSPSLPSFSMTYSKPMDTGFCGASTRNWPYGSDGSCTWSADKITMTVTRYNPETPLTPGLKIEAYLVDPEWNPPESYLRDAEGNHVDPCYFTVSGSSDNLMLDGLHCLDNYVYVN